jgi:hypothetical protein
MSDIPSANPTGQFRSYSIEAYLLGALRSALDNWRVLFSSSKSGQLHFQFILTSIYCMVVISNHKTYMDINTQSEFECSVCDGSGSYLIGNGRDDFDREFCSCPAGIQLQEEQETAPFNPLDASAVLQWFNA